MAGELQFSCRFQSPNIATPPVSIHVMVVDDDATSLAVISGLLQTLNYEVTSFNDPIRALYSLREAKQHFDLIITDLYMPKMDGFELTKRVDEEFKLPVIMISSDDRESVMFRAIQEGAVLYLLKPFTLKDLRNIWQFAISTKSRSKMNPNLFMEESGSHGAEAFPAFEETYSEEAISVSSENEGRREKKKDSTKGGSRIGENQEIKLGNAKRASSASATKKPKVIWTDFLQYRFLQAVHYIGLDRAVPKKILEAMNVPGLTRENVASHLQKYRIFLRKVAERCMLASDKTTEKVLWSKFLSRHASLVLKKIQHKKAGFLSQQQPQRKGNTLQSGEGAKGRHVSLDRNPKPPFSGNPNSFLTNRASGFGSYAVGHTTSSIGSAINPPKMYQNQAQVFNFRTRGTQATDSYNPQFPDLAYFDNSHSTFHRSNYAGFSVGIRGELSVMGGNGNCKKGISKGCDFVNGIPSGTYQSFEPMGLGNSGCLTQGNKYGLGIGGEDGFIWDSMYDSINFHGNSQPEHCIVDVRDSSHTLMDLDNQDGGQEEADSDFFASLFPLESFVDNHNTNQQQGSGDDSNQLCNMNSAAEETAPTSPLPISIDDQVLDEFLESWLRNESSAEEQQWRI